MVFKFPEYGSWKISHSIIWETFTVTVCTNTQSVIVLLTWGLCRGSGCWAQFHQGLYELIINAHSLQSLTLKRNTKHTHILQLQTGNIKYVVVSSTKCSMNSDRTHSNSSFFVAHCSIVYSGWVVHSQDMGESDLRVLHWLVVDQVFGFLMKLYVGSKLSFFKAP